MEWFFVSATWLDVIALSACAGVLACVIWVLPRTAPAHLYTRLWVGFGGALVLLTGASIVLLASRTLEFSGAPFSGLSFYLPLVLTKTQYGLIWELRMVAVAGLWFCLLVGLRPKWRLWMASFAMVMLVVVMYTRSATGHAGDQGTYATGVWVDCAHVLASGIWVGALFVMSLLVFPALRRQLELDQTLAADVFTRLSKVATVALGVIVATGLFNAWFGLDSLNNLWLSGYGRILSFKVLLVLWMIYIGGHNRYLKLPALRRSAGLSAGHSRWERIPGWRPLSEDPDHAPHVLARCVRAVHLESVLGVVVLAAAAVLHHGMPPADMHPMAVAAGTSATAYSMAVPPNR